ncbi:MAG TPA: DUF4340 domain-containing protein [Urbifossiella sp.]|jgi:hypothetical protein|nr:DUF4340 domain-containing protein [Urbifossiella sp.]
MPTNSDQQHTPRADHRSHAPMNFRLTAGLFGLIFVIGLILLGLSFFGGTTPPAAGGLLLKDLAGEKADAVSEVEVEKPDGSKLVLRRTGKDAWGVEAPVKARADKQAVEAVVTAVLGLRPTAYGELQDNPAVHGLDAPLKVTLKTEGGKSETVNIGDLTIGGAKAVGFVSTAARPRPMAVSKSALDALLKDTGKAFGHAKDMAKWATDYRIKAVFAADNRAGGDDVSAVKLTRNGKDLALTRGKTGWEFASPAGWGDASTAADPAAAPGALTGVRPLVAGLTGLAAGAADDFLDAPADLAQYGLNPGNPDRVRVEIKTNDGKTEVAFIGKKADGDKKDEKKDTFAPPAKVYVQIEGTPGVIRAAAGGLDGLAAVIDNPTPLRDRDLVHDDVKARVDAIDVTTGGQTVQLRKPAGSTEWKLAGGPNDPQAANQAAAAALLNLVTQPRVVKEFPPANDANFAGATEVKLYADAVEPGGDPKAAPKLKAGVAPTVLQFGKRDPAGVYVRRTRPDGSKTDFIVPDKVKVGTDPAETDVLAAVTKIRFDYLDPALPTFSQFQANKLQLTQGQVVTLEVAKDKAAAGSADPGWKYAKPDPMKGQTADSGTVGDLLNLLANQQAGKFVREIGEADKARERDFYLGYGLLAENPRLKVVVGLDAPAPGNERVYYLGNETDDKQSVYARVDGRPVVFTVPKFVYDRFAGADLRDRTLVRFDAGKLKSVRVRGWREATGGEMLVREFRKEGAGWVAVTPPGFSVDPAKVDEFVRAVQGLRVKDFRTGPEHPDHRFAPEQSGFEITLDLDGADDIILNVAAEVDGGTARIAKVDTLSTPPRTQLVTVIPDALKAFRDSAKSFAR